MLDDHLVAEAESSLRHSGVQFQIWLQQQVEAVLRKQVNRRRNHVRRSCLSDEQLAQQLAHFAPLTDDDFPELNKSDYDNYIRSASGRTTKGIEKWL